MYNYAFSTVIFSNFCDNSNRLRQILKKNAELSPIGETLPPFVQVLGIFLFHAWLGTGTSYGRIMSIFEIQAAQYKIPSAKIT